MKVVVACDSFKGSISSNEINECIKQSLKSIYPNYVIKTFELGDGGEGTMDSIIRRLKGKRIQTIVHGPLMEQMKSEYGIINENIAIIEMASCSGLTLIPKELRNPLKTTTFGVGEMIYDAVINQKVKKVIVGIGGSGTNDGGTGMLEALGFQFKDSKNKILGVGGEILNQIESIDSSCVSKEILNIPIIVACDVNNPFYGKNGAAFIYSRQKGADDQMIQQLDNGLEHFAQVIKKVKKIDLNQIPGTGAAGGLGGGFIGFLNAELKPGIELILDLFQFDQIIEDAQYIITGEGRIDEQSFMGKVLCGILKRAQKYKIKVIAIGGAVEVDSNTIDPLLSVFCIQNKPITLEDAMKKEEVIKNVTVLIRNIFKLLQQ
ncbi:glycerate kinase, putative [Entamoeba histolytica HM-1:IMSS-B]|uniref:Glycerate kinase, putative n=6 Tax=Entamoeba histolytica TaxID=5759 RepID=A0A8U0WPG1_ENTH1|nr:glycerate kinase, putative [Entamoeba histolytica HM-1:IMSS]EMD44557.1 glycerate kinase, putative [Entamoeba histolytica KU27]EMH78107.1 glycerate kinase, putative [Entamoeba histolytica HM-1:IMSS-B]EMS13966.1 glycerate kinase [Entamoeba histolytica HM-3:IMSS]ENY62656.1 glycerate kinase, putative [Entamoeba histolytica HM-1:IMSS-A]BAE19926.1 glycerate kinase [Entamoeba histolytica]|eukprot:XP_650055.1 glycerate kinase, putative [Entamoeba histolytica HM-1:IMSS]